MKFSIKDLITFTEKIRNGKLHFLCCVMFELQKKSLPSNVGTMNVIIDCKRLEIFHSKCL